VLEAPAAAKEKSTRKPDVSTAKTGERDVAGDAVLLHKRSRNCLLSSLHNYSLTRHATHCLLGVTTHYCPASQAKQLHTRCAQCCMPHCTLRCTARQTGHSMKSAGALAHITTPKQQLKRRRFCTSVIQSTQRREPRPPRLACLSCGSNQLYTHTTAATGAERQPPPCSRWGRAFTQHMKASVHMCHSPAGLTHHSSRTRQQKHKN
jgi:hypothetical protein